VRVSADLFLIMQFLNTELLFCFQLFTLKFQLTLSLLICLRSTLVQRLTELIALVFYNSGFIFRLGFLQIGFCRSHFRLLRFRLIELVISFL